MFNFMLISEMHRAVKETKEVLKGTIKTSKALDSKRKKGTPTSQSLF